MGGRVQLRGMLTEVVPVTVTFKLRFVPVRVRDQYAAIMQDHRRIALECGMLNGMNRSTSFSLLLSL